MKCLILCSSPISHIIPLESLIDNLIENDVEVYAVSVLNNKSRIEKFGAHFIEYPFDFVGGSKIKRNMKISENYYRLLSEEKYYDAYYSYVYEDTKSFYTHNLDNLIKLFEIAKKINPDFILRDAVDRYGSIVAKMLLVPCVGYITHNLYSKQFFSTNPSYYYKIFMRSLNQSELLPNDFFKNFRDECENINDIVFRESDTFKIYTHHQFDPREEFTLINSIDGIQPKESLENDRKYELMYPALSRFKIEKDIPSDLREFIENSQNVVYIASGSMISFPPDFYIQLINGLVNNGFKLVISFKNDLEILYDKIPEKMKNNVKIYNFVPQQYVLSNSKLFITTGGQNSIIESIYHKVPMLVFPVTSEQSINGLIIEKEKIGKTTYIERENYMTIGELIKEILSDKQIEANLECLSNRIKYNNCDYSKFWSYLNDELKKTN